MASHKKSKSTKRRSSVDISSFFQPNETGTGSPLRQRLEEDTEENNGGVIMAMEEDSPGPSRGLRVINDIAGALNKRLDKESMHRFLESHWNPPEDYPFPRILEGQQHRKFLTKWLPHFDWLVYSAQMEGAFCKFCVIFGQFEAGGQTPGVLVTSPMTKYKNALKDFSDHAALRYHLFSATKAGEFRALLKTNKSVPILLDKNKSDAINFNKKRLVSIVKTILLCARCKLPLRGHRETENLKSEGSLRACESGQEGIFRAFLAFRVDSGDKDLAWHLSTAEKSCTMISPKIQNEIIEIIGKYLQSKVLDAVKKARFFTILCDETTDVSTREQMTICIRYINMEDFKVCEDFLGFVNVSSTTGQSLKESLCGFLDAAGLSLANLRGQGFDGGSNMSGKFRGLQALIRQEQELAFYVHCFAHRLNLSVSKGCAVPLVRNMLGTLASVSTFLSASAKRVSVMKEIIENSKLGQSRKQKLKPLCQTRWTERHNSVMIFRELFPYILQALEVIKDENDANTASSASMFEAAITRADFIVALESTVSVLSHTHSLSVLLQDPKLDLSQALGSISTVITALQSMKDSAKESFKAVFEMAKTTADQHGTVISTPRTCSRQAHRNNTKGSDAEEYFRLVIFVPLLDHFINDISSRFHGTLSNVFALQGLIPSKLGDYSNDAILQAATIYEQDLPCLSMTEVLSEMSIRRGRWSSEMVKPASAVEALIHCNGIFPNLRILLQIFWTLPITTATADRTFSVLQLLKTYLRSTMTEDRLNGLALATIYKTVDVDINAVFDMFAKAKPRRLERFDWSHE